MGVAWYSPGIHLFRTIKKLQNHDDVGISLAMANAKGATGILTPAWDMYHCCPSRISLGTDSPAKTNQVDIVRTLSYGEHATFEALGSHHHDS
ncbi:hypothetical protein OH492_14505 [Vibrio chagasii]|nr:hypothetical protein [Vibrio chagasii]